VNDTLRPENHTLLESNPLVAEHLQPKRIIVEDQHCANPETRGCMRIHDHADAQLTNWQSAFLWAPIQRAAALIGRSPSAIERWLKIHNPSLFGRLTLQVIGRWITEDNQGKKRWQDLSS
jgi:hypothetical protein